MAQSDVKSSRERATAVSSCDGSLNENRGGCGAMGQSDLKQDVVSNPTSHGRKKFRSAHVIPLK